MPGCEVPSSFRWKSRALRQLAPSSVLWTSSIIRGVGSQVWDMSKSGFLMRGEKSLIKTLVIKSVF